MLGHALLALKRYDEVLAEMRVALELDHTSLPAQTLKGEALLKKGDPDGALDVLQRAKLQSPNDPKIAELVAEASRGMGRVHPTASHPAVGFVGGTTKREFDENTRHYPNHADDEDTSDDEGRENTGDSYTRPTSLAAPSAKKKTPGPALIDQDRTPPPSVLAVGDKSGTVEVDPELDGVELDGDDDFDEVAAPPRSLPVPARAIANNSVRGTVIPSTRTTLPPPTRMPNSAEALTRRKKKVDISTVELEDDEVVEVEDSSPGARAIQHRPPGPGTQVRNAVNFPSGPLEPRPPTAASRPTAAAPAIAPPPHLAHLMQAQPPQHSSTLMGPGTPIAAALPTMAAQHVQRPMPLGGPQQAMLPMPSPMIHQMPLAPPPMVNPAAVRPTMALNAAQQQSADALDNALFGNPAPPPPGAWHRATDGRSPAEEPTHRPAPLHPNFAIEASQSGVAMLEPSQSGVKPLKTGMRKGRSRLQIVIWFVIGGLVIGGGVFAGFQIRAMRLTKQITAAREQAIELAKADTWKGWIGARDRLAGIAQASATPDNRAALVRARALVAFEFGDGLAEAKGSLEALGDQTGFDLDIAAAYVALAQNDASAARTAADHALITLPDDPAALYVAGQASLLAGDVGAATKELKSAFDKEQRPLYAVGLARAYGESSAWKDALATIDKALALSSDHPGALIARGQLLAASGQISPTSSTIGAEVRAQLQKLVTEGLKQPGEQTRGVSPTQVGMTNLVLTHVDFLRNDMPAMQADFRAALSVMLDEQRFAEQAVETLFAIGELAGSRAAAERALAEWPASKRARIAMARVLLAQGKPTEALAILAKVNAIKESPLALAVRGHAQLALNELDAARKDFDLALKRSPNFELAVVGRTWVDIESNELPTALERIEPRYTATPTSAAIATAYAAALRRGGEPAARDKARIILEKVVAGPPGLDVTRAQLELARIYRDIGDMRAAKVYADASRTGSLEARLESGVLLIEFRNPEGGRDTLEQLLKGSEKPSPNLLVETARARMLVGDHKGAAELLAEADKSPNVVRWKYDRERGRLAMRKGDYTGAASALTAALETCGDDSETFLIAAEVAAADDKQSRLADKVKQLAPQRLKARPAEIQIITGKLLLGKGEEASRAYESAKDLLDKEKAVPRRLAQAHLGRAIVAYNRQDDPAALDALDLALELDPSLYEAYLYYADIAKDKDPKKALEKAKLAVQYNPDMVDAHQMVGVVAHKLGNRKLLADSITRLTELAPNSVELKTLQALR
ncbi:MAG: tetratricopeptide repeat protein [Kofleriaceae bacterium]